MGKELLQTSGLQEYAIVHWTGPNYSMNIFNNLSWLRAKQNVYKKWASWRITVGLNWGNKEDAGKNRKHKSEDKLLSPAFTKASPH